MYPFILDIFAVETTFELVVVLIDVTIVFYLIYRILHLIKGTRAVEMLIGLIAIILFFFASKEEYFNLPTLNWLLDKFIGSFILIIVVIFQDDIRRGLSQVGGVPFVSSPLSAREETQVFEEIIKACVNLSERRLGALIAVEREANLAPYTSQGVAIHARVTQQLLFATFLPNHQNPLHDGAVIIQKDQLTSAACFLPLTKNPNVEQSLGTRHRAGIGLSEETDAAVLIVSEESGTISVAFRGKLIRGLDASRLRDVLHWIFASPSRVTEERDNETIIHWLRDNLRRSPRPPHSSTKPSKTPPPKDPPQNDEHKPEPHPFSSLAEPITEPDLEHNPETETETDTDDPKTDTQDPPKPNTKPTPSRSKTKRRRRKPRSTSTLPKVATPPKEDSSS